MTFFPFQHFLFWDGYYQLAYYHKEISLRPFKCQRGDRLLFIGDSITDAGKTNHAPPLGEGYVKMLASHLNQNHADLHLGVINHGISGNTIEGLTLRWDQDVISENPDWLFIMIGINDAHVTLNHSEPPSKRISIFTDMYTDLLSPSLKIMTPQNICLMTPFLISSEPESPIAQLNASYVKTVLQLGEQFQIPTLNLQNIFTQTLTKHAPDYWSADGVHPFPHGHDLIHQTIYQYLSQ